MKIMLAAAILTLVVLLCLILYNIGYNNGYNAARDNERSINKEIFDAIDSAPSCDKCRMRNICPNRLYNGRKWVGCPAFEEEPKERKHV